MKNSQIQRFFVSGNTFIINFSNGSEIKSSCYSFVDYDGKKHDTSLEIPIIEEQWQLLEECEFEPSTEIQQKIDALGVKKDLLSEKNELIGTKLLNIIESWSKNTKLLDIKYTSLEKFSLSFSGIKNFSIELYAKSFSPYTIKIQTKDFDFQITDTDCEITCEKVIKDYKSFSSAAKSRFRNMANELGYEQITGITYVKERDGWYETFNLQSSSY